MSRTPKTGYKRYVHGVKIIVKKYWRNRTDQELALLSGASLYTIRHLRADMGLKRDPKNWKQMQMRGIKASFGKK